MRARAGEPAYRDYFHIHRDRSVPDAYEATMPEVFPDFAPGSFTWDDEAGGWVWTTFNQWQWDLNWANPEVLVEFAEIVLFLANHGVEVIRLDAIAFLWKRLGTNCQNQPEVHAVTRLPRPPAPGSPIFAVTTTSVGRSTTATRRGRAQRLRDHGIQQPYDTIGGYPVTAGADGIIWLPPYAAWWVVQGKLPTWP